MRVAIAGGTGTVGRHVVRAAKAAGHDTVILSRATGVDLMNAAGLADRLAGVDAVIDTSAPSTLSTKKAIAFFGTITHNLLAAERAAGVHHHVLPSIIGAADADSGYYAGKRFQEQQVISSGDSWSLLRTTQFHEFAQQTVDRGTTLGVFLAPKMRSRPIAASAVATQLVAIAADGPQGHVADLAGPKEESMPDLVRRYARAAGRHNPVLSVTLPGPMGQAMRSGGLLPYPGTREDTQTFDEWLTAVQR
ncbi:NAD(P)H-binding protein [Frigoribacterium sp. CFBP 13729]|uniref:SDR family oxidoreductase n=1 Tax=unclassified Frigoribacterium TaxID=2627005 RepID=UPI001783DF2D|nr:MULTISPECIES: NAD(P)H-binding protein [unclassified Frigoribacterium]MBD8586165.1 NAD(P)H-binding protein [Frigoribacterium sp. CFBP 8766]MBD8612079.1 NAD(P)H-binding protein [Frigoribacterium sp. CFBP 13729]